jgi:hypothetical protein
MGQVIVIAHRSSTPRHGHASRFAHKVTSYAGRSDDHRHQGKLSSGGCREPSPDKMHRSFRCRDFEPFAIGIAKGLLSNPLLTFANRPRFKFSRQQSLKNAIKHIPMPASPKKTTDSQN